MKKHVFFWKVLVGVLPFLFLGAACDSTSDDPAPYLRISKGNEAIALSAEGSSQTIGIETNTTEWVVTVSAEGKDWCTVKKEGENLVISVVKNEGVSDRSAKVTVSVQNIVVTITVTQSGTTPFLQIDEKDRVLQPFEISGGTAEVNILTNIPLGELVVALSDATATWCEPKIENGKLTIYVGENIREESRTVDVIITSNRIPAEQQKITVTQFGKGYTLQIAEDSRTLHFEVTGGIKIVKVTTNIPAADWSFASVTADWYDIVKGDNQLTITVKPNSGWDERTAEITLKSDKLPEVQPKIVVTQAAVIPVLEIEGALLRNVSYTGNNEIVVATTNIPVEDLTIQYNPNSEWYHFLPISDGKLAFGVDAISTDEEIMRTVAITITSPKHLSNAAPLVITFTQRGIPGLQVDVAEKDIAAGGETFPVNVTAKNIPAGEWIFTSNNEDTWYHITKSDNQLNIQVDENTSMVKRTVVLTLSSSDLPTGTGPTITVSQAGAPALLKIDGEEVTRSLAYAAGSEIVATTNIPLEDLNISYNNESTSSWCSAAIVEGKLKINVTPNTAVGAEQRSVEIKITSDHLPDTTLTINLTQAIPTLGIALDAATQEFDAAGDSKEVAINTNIPNENWTFSPSVEGNWYHVAKGDKQLTIQVDANTSLEARTVVLTLSSSDFSGVSPTITINQAGGTDPTPTPVLELAGSNTREFEAAGGSEIVATTNIPFEYLNISYVYDQASSGWCSAEIVEGELKINVTPNDDAGAAPRSVEITITSDRLPGTTRTITVTQAIPSVQPPIVQWTVAKLGNTLPSDAVSALYKLVGGKIEIKGLGKFESAKQSFTFAYREVTDDFVITARLDSYDYNANASSGVIGLLFTTPDFSTVANTAKPSLVYGGVGIASAKDNPITYIAQHRLQADGTRSSSGLTAPKTGAGEGGVYFKLKKQNGKYEASYSLNGNIEGNYGDPKVTTFAGLPAKLYVGLVVSSGDGSKLATALFSDIRVDGVLQSFENVVE
ncbi:hypothetical protein EZS27_007337 [termite gut metagenome]|uniref:BACON domain-containing protein n=1 Tax=termite gut metagenome TaxID=433724 RepID=A0A5J4SIB9_9ZZZZ